MWSIAHLQRSQAGPVSLRLLTLIREFRKSAGTRWISASCFGESPSYDGVNFSLRKLSSYASRLQPIRALPQLLRDVKYRPISTMSEKSRGMTYRPTRAMSQVPRDDVTYCRDRGYLTTHVTPLPRLSHLNDSAPRAFINYARTDQLEEMKRMILLAEERGDGVGRGELTTSSRRSHVLFNRSEIFAVTLDNKSTFPGTSSLTHSQGHPSTEVDAFIAISPCLYARTYDPCLATVRVFRSARLSGDDRAYRSLVHLAVQLTDEINCGYTHVVIDIALCHVNLLRQLKDEGFHVTAIIPDNVYVNGVGACENVIVVKRFRQNDRPVRSTRQVIEMLERVDPCAEFMKQYSTMSLPELSFLPQPYVFSNGVEAVIRNMRREDDEQLFNMLSYFIKHGQGYGVNEYPSLEYFRKDRVLPFYTLVVEDVRTKKMIAFGNLLVESHFCRGWHAPGLGTLNMNPEFRGTGISSEILALEAFMGKELGQTRILANTFLSNSGTKLAVKQSQLSAVHIGVIPNTGYLKSGEFWEDTLLFDCRIDNTPTFTQVARKNCENRTKKLIKARN